MEAPRPETAEIAIRNVFEESPRDTEFARRARSLLTIGGRLQSWHEPEALEAEILKQLLEVTPADTAAIVRLAPNPLGEPLVRDISIFSDDVTMSGEFSGLSSLNRRRVDSVIVVPLVPTGVRLVPSTWNRFPRNIA